MTTAKLPIDALETIYDALARAIDQASESASAEIFLTKLALLNANALGDPALFHAHLQAALEDL